MIFTQTPLVGAYLVQIEKLEDYRGFFARTWCEKEFASHGLLSNMAQASVSYNIKKGTLRGLHFQSPPCQEAKLVRCVQGEIFDVIVDVRPTSPTYLKHFSILLSAAQRNALYIPPGFAHGFQTLTDHAEIFYQMTERYQPQFANGFRWNDPAFNIEWPEDNRTILDRDNQYPDFDPRLVKGFSDNY